MDIRRIDRRFQTRFKIDNGPSFYGVIIEIPDTTRMSSMSAPKRILQVQENAPVAARDTFVTPAGTRFLVAEYGEGYLSGMVSYRRWILYHIDQTMTWKRPGTTTDPLTGLKKGTGTLTDLGTIYAHVSPRAPVLDEMKIPEDRTTIVTGSALQLGDIVNGETVKRVDLVTGVYVAELI